jgi:hypothetical protein
MYGVLRAFENSRAMPAVLEVKFHTSLKFRLDLSVNVVGDLSPHLDTTDFDDCRFHIFNPLVKEITTA